MKPKGHQPQHDVNRAVQPKARAGRNPVVRIKKVSTRGAGIPKLKGRRAKG